MCDTDVSKLYYLNELVHIIRDQTSVVSVSARQAQMANLHISNGRCAGIPRIYLAVTRSVDMSGIWELN